MRVGIMQGRLLPRYKDRYQAHPLHFWEGEFYIAKELGFDCIEFILDYNDAEHNPLLSEEGVARIKNICDTTGVQVHSICADYFMEAPFHSDHQSQSERLMETLIQHCAALPVQDIVIPCVDQSSLKTDQDKRMLADSLSRLLPIAEAQGIYLNLETDMAPRPFIEFVNQVQSPALKINYDTGNSASLGFDPTEEFHCYGHLISDLHIKDRVLNGGSVQLGTGHTNFDLVFQLLRQHQFNHTVILQASRKSDYIEDLSHVRAQYAFIRPYLDTLKKEAV